MKFHFVLLLLGVVLSTPTSPRLLKDGDYVGMTTKLFDENGRVLSVNEEEKLIQLSRRSNGEIFLRFNNIAGTFGNFFRGTDNKSLQFNLYNIFIASIHAGIRMDSALEIVFNPCSQTVGLRWATDGPISFFLGGSVFTSTIETPSIDVNLEDFSKDWPLPPVLDGKEFKVDNHEYCSIINVPLLDARARLCAGMSNFTVTSMGVSVCPYARIELEVNGKSRTLIEVTWKEAKSIGGLIFDQMAGEKSCLAGSGCKCLHLGIETICIVDEESELGEGARVVVAPSAAETFRGLDGDNDMMLSLDDFKSGLRALGIKATDIAFKKHFESFLGKSISDVKDQLSFEQFADYAKCFNFFVEQNGRRLSHSTYNLHTPKPRKYVKHWTELDHYAKPIVGSKKRMMLIRREFDESDIPNESRSLVELVAEKNEEKGTFVVKFCDKEHQDAESNPISLFKYSQNLGLTSQSAEMFLLLQTNTCFELEFDPCSLETSIEWASTGPLEFSLALKTSGLANYDVESKKFSVNIGDYSKHWKLPSLPILSKLESYFDDKECQFETEIEIPALSSLGKFNLCGSLRDYTILQNGISACPHVKVSFGAKKLFEFEWKNCDGDVCTCPSFGFPAVCSLLSSAEGIMGAPRIIQSFLGLDSNNDFKIDFDEFKNTLECLGVFNTELGFKTHFNRVDEDGDGQVSYKEMQTYQREQERSNQEESHPNYGDSTLPDDKKYVEKTSSASTTTISFLSVAVVAFLQ